MAQGRTSYRIIIIRMIDPHRNMVCCLPEKEVEGEGMVATTCICVIFY
ncbi:MAG: hypothetical protein WBL88_04675 [Nitrososphaeraceae archaeon]